MIKAADLEPRISNECVRVRSLNFKKHRFDSMQKPLSRFCLYFEAILGVAISTCTRRTGDPAQFARDFLTYIDEEKCMLLSMMADGADSCDQLIRHADTESHDYAELSMQVEVFQQELHYLFTQGHCFEHGYTKHMLDTLEKSRGWCIQGQFKQLGGKGRVSAQMLHHCLEKMRAWVALAYQVIRAEFPQASLRSAIAIFDISERATAYGKNKEGLNQMKHRTHCLQRLAKMFTLNPKALEKQFCDILPRAESVVRTSGQCSFEAWRDVVMRLWSSKARKGIFSPT